MERARRIGRHNVPEPLTTLIGRNEDLRRVSELAREQRIVTLVGVGGVGKTRLALAAARAAVLDWRSCARTMPISGPPSRTRSSARITGWRVGRDAARLDDRRRDLGCRAPADPPELSAAAAPGVSRGARPARRLGPCLVRGPRAACTLLVYVDDATSRLMELCFAAVESTFDYFRATRRYLERHGKPMAFYSDSSACSTSQRRCLGHHVGPRVPRGSVSLIAQHARWSKAACAEAEVVTARTSAVVATDRTGTNSIRRLPFRLWIVVVDGGPTL